MVNLPLFGSLQAYPVISLWQPWASLWTAGIKLNETRSWPLPEVYRHRRVLVHAARHWSHMATMAGDPTIADCMASLVPLLANTPGADRRLLAVNGRTVALPVGAIIGSVVLQDCYQLVSPNDAANRSLTFQEQRLGDYEPGRYVWVGAQHQTFKEFWPAVGRQGFFKHEIEVLPDTWPPDWKSFTETCPS